MHSDKETFRYVIGHFASGVTVLTSRGRDEDSGATASAVSSLSLERLGDRPGCREGGALCKR
jgi:flavin reductase (DIM6/NTAB) family NADH-FMN oxidoreductase RutF